MLRPRSIGCGVKDAEHRRTVQRVKAANLIFVHRLKVFATAIGRQFIEDMGKGGMGLQMLALSQYHPTVHPRDPEQPHFLQNRRTQVRQQRKRDMTGSQTPGHHLNR